MRNCIPPGATKHAAWFHFVAVDGFSHFQCAQRLFRRSAKGLVNELRHVLDDDDAGRANRREIVGTISNKRLRSTRGAADGDELGTARHGDGSTAQRLGRQVRRPWVRTPRRRNQPFEFRCRRIGRPALWDTRLLLDVGNPGGDAVELLGDESPPRPTPSACRVSCAPSTVTELTMMTGTGILGHDLLQVLAGRSCRAFPHPS
jgi:hypothetical protein